MPSPRQLALLVLLILMELLPGFVVLVGTSLLDATSASYGLFWLILLVAVIGLTQGLLIAPAEKSRRFSRLIMVIGGVVTVGISSVLVATGVVTLLVSAVILALAFWRGAATGAEVPGHDQVRERFDHGVGILFVGILWVVARGIIAERPIWQMLAVIGITFVVVSMTALVLARIERVREPGAAGAIALAVSIQLGTLVLVSVVALQLFAIDLAGALGHLTQPAVDATGRTLFNVLAYIADPVQRFLDLIRPHGKPGTLPGRHAVQSDNAHIKRPKYHRPFNSPVIVWAALSVVASFLAAIGYLIWRALPSLRRQSPSSGRPYVEKRQTVTSLSALWRALAAWLQGLLRRSGPMAGAAIRKTRRRFWGEPYPADPVRGLYARLLRRAASRGLPRTDATTPAEFQLLLAQRWPQGSVDFALITAAYVRRRYGSPASGQESMVQLQRSWDNLRRVIRRPSAPTPDRDVSAVHNAPARPERPRGQPIRPIRWEAATRRLGGENAASRRPQGAAMVLLGVAIPVLLVVSFFAALLLLGGHLGG